MKTLVLAVDRDNDLGEKAGVKAPVIGRDKVVEAANKLALSDPEDSDLNVLFGAVKIKDEYGDEAEVAVITGDKEVGVISDKEITKQLEEVLDKTKPRDVVVVTDGAEDEFILPIIQSRVPVTHLRRIIVQQSPGLEKTYVIFLKYLKKTLRDPKSSRTFLGIPGVVFVLYPVTYYLGILLGVPISFSRIVVGLIGAYLLFRAFDLGKYLSTFKTGFRKLTVMGEILSIGLLSIGIYRGFSGIDWASGGYLEVFSSYYSKLFIWVVMAITVFSIAKIVESATKGSGIRLYLTTMLYGWAINLLALGVLTELSIAYIVMAVAIFWTSLFLGRIGPRQ